MDSRQDRQERECDLSKPPIPLPWDRWPLREEFRAHLVSCGVDPALADETLARFAPGEEIRFRAEQSPRSDDGMVTTTLQFTWSTEAAP